MLTIGVCDGTDHDGRAEEAEHHKQDQLQKQKEGKGHWKDELASDSESIVRFLSFFNFTVLCLLKGETYQMDVANVVCVQVKADRGEISNAKDDIAELQKETAKLAQNELKEKTEKGV